MGKKLKNIKFWLNISSLILMLIGIVLGIQALYLRHLEILAQLSKYGFYDDKITLLVNRDYMQTTCWIGMIISYTLALDLFLASISYKEKNNDK